MTKHPHLSRVLRDLKARFGVEANDLTPDELFSLVECIQRIESPFSAVNADAVGFPVSVAEGVTLWRLTAGASVWLDEYAARWWGDKASEKKYFWALVYSLANARNNNAFVKATDENTAYKLIRDFVLGLPVTLEELERAVDVVLDNKAVAKEGDGKGATLMEGRTDWARMCARLESQSGIKQEDWLWGHSAAYLVRTYQDLSYFARKYSAVGGDSGHMLDELDEAENALARLLVKIGKRVRADKQGGEV